MEFKRKARVSGVIPTASMADIAFLLLIFFMVSTVFVRYRGLRVVLPRAEKIERIETKRNITYIWVTPQGMISIDDVRVEKVSDLRSIVYRKRVENPRVIVSLKIDKNTPYKLVSDVMEELRKADALRVNFATLRER